MFYPATTWDFTLFRIQVDNFETFCSTKFLAACWDGVRVLGLLASKLPVAGSLFEVGFCWDEGLVEEVWGLLEVEEVGGT